MLRCAAYPAPGASLKVFFLSYDNVFIGEAAREFASICPGSLGQDSSRAASQLLDPIYFLNFRAWARNCFSVVWFASMGIEPTIFLAR
jgi:hypothetical protein